MEVLTHYHDPRSQGWQIVNRTAGRHNLNIPKSPGRLGTTSEQDLQIATTNADTPPRQAAIPGEWRFGLPRAVELAFSWEVGIHPIQ
jgi:hypothetical protein